jgi:hypothetical protein
MKKLFAIFLIMGLTHGAFGGGGCDCSNKDDTATDTDSVYNTSVTCTWHNSDMRNYTSARIYGEKGVVKVCKYKDAGSAGCSGRCRHYVYEWIPENGSCVSGKSVQDKTIDWISSASRWRTCWQPKCINPKEYWQAYIGENINSSTISDKIYRKCAPCKLQPVTLVTTDPTQYSILLGPAAGS